MIINISIELLTIAALLLSGRTFSAPVDSTDMWTSTIEAAITTIVAAGDITTAAGAITAAEATTAAGFTTAAEAVEETATEAVADGGAEATTTVSAIETALETTSTTTSAIALESDREWEDLVLAGPSVVNYLGLFMVLASRKDQILIAPAAYAVKYVLNPSSLRATLSQVSSSMQNAFKVAHDDLIRTRTSMDQIPGHIKAGLLLIQTAPNTLLGQLLPYIICNVDRAANEGSAVTKPTLERFVSVGLLIEELVTLVGGINSTNDNAEFLVEAKDFAMDMKNQWNLLIKLFHKFSDRADITQETISNRFINPIEQAQKSNEFNDDTDRVRHLEKLILEAITIDQSSYLLSMMASTYSHISDEHMIEQIQSNIAYLSLETESARAISQRQLWHNSVTQSVKVARLAQERQHNFIDTNPKRHEEYTAFSNSVLAS